ncbi:uncharacterized protein [Typha angustifolia]|uniref:uncharacterized protein isoform X1 n=1 Tax=Typha angustifolia TaxID=59011 RepID=UPI003C2CB59E
MADPTLTGASPEMGVDNLGGSGVTRKDKRKALKKLKRKQVRREVAVKEREEEESRSKDPEEQLRIRIREQQEAEIAELERRAFEERERLWLEAAAARKAAEEEEEAARKKLLEESQHEKSKEKEQAGELEDGEEWDYVEEGPAEIIWQGNEIIVKKKMVKIPKRGVDRKPIKEDDDRPTSNPLPPQSTAYAAHRKEASSSAQEVLEKVAQQTPNFGTEQDKAHCPFHLKTGACRFGSRCSRVHFYPDKSCTLLMKNMYNGPGLAWEQDEGLEYTDEEVDSCYEEFYEDVHTEFLKFGELVNFKVCRNGSYHLRGNVYVHYRSLDSAVLAYNSINGRFFAGKQITCEYVGVTRWKVAICGEYMKSRLKQTCSRGTACNFIHCFRNPGGDYEWADWDNPPPKYWIRKMASLFGHLNESGYDKQMELQDYGRARSSKRKRTPTSKRNGTRSSTDEIMRDRDDSITPSYQYNGHLIRRERSSSRREAATFDKHKQSKEVKSDVKYDSLSSSSGEDMSRERDRGSHRKYPSYEEKNSSYNSKRGERKHRQKDSQRRKGGNGRSRLARYNSKYHESQKEEDRSSDCDSDFIDDYRDPRNSPSSYNSSGRPNIDEERYNGRYHSENLSLEKDSNSVHESEQNDRFGETREHDQHRKQNATNHRGDSDDSADSWKTTNSDVVSENSHDYLLCSRSSGSTRKHNGRGRKKIHHDEKAEYEENNKDLGVSDSDSWELNTRAYKRHSRSHPHHQSSSSFRRKVTHNSSFDT